MSKSDYRDGIIFGAGWAAVVLLIVAVAGFVEIVDWPELVRQIGFPLKAKQ